VKLILDLMGGDNGPLAALEGAQQALAELEQTASTPLELIFLGDEVAAKEYLKRSRMRTLANAIASQDKSARVRVRFVHAPQTIDMEDSIRAIRTKPGASINVGCKMAGESYAKGEAAAFISAGHSGAVMASAFLHMGRLKGVERPAIAVKLPTLSEDGCVILDVGANVDCKPEHLRDFAIMGACFGQMERKRPGLPKVALLSNGEEKSKGNDQVRAARELIEPLACFQPGPEAVGQFIGYAEGKEIFKGQVDVVVTDGFVGNLVLKSVEGLGSAVMSMVKSEARKSWLAPIGFLLASSVFTRLKKKLDYAEYGAAPLLGVAGYAFICHGRSNARAMKNAILRARTALNAQVVQHLEHAMHASSMASNVAASTVTKPNPASRTAGPPNPGSVREL
jgi:glycerol-3-phosphate acyltransferase PlsX